MDRSQRDRAYATEIGELGSAGSGRQGMACLPSDGEPVRRLSARPGQPGRSSPGSGRRRPSAPPRGFRSRFLGRARAGRPWRAARCALAAALLLLAVAGVVQAQRVTLEKDENSVLGCNDGCPHRPTGFAEPGSGLGQIYVEWMPATEGPAATGQFSVSLGSSAQGPSAVAIENSGVTLTLGTPATPGQQATVTYTKPDSNPIRDVNGNDAADFSDQAVANNMRPEVVGAKVDGATLTVTFDTALDEDSTPSTGAFAVAGSSTGLQQPGSVAVSGREVTLTLGTAVAEGETVVLGYSKPADNASPLLHTSGVAVASFAGQAVANATGDATRPRVVRAVLNGTTLRIFFDEALDPAFTPPGGHFALTHGASNDNSIVGTGTASIEGITVTVTLGSALPAGETAGNAVYFPQGTDRLRAGVRIRPKQQGGPPLARGSRNPQRLGN